MARWPIRRPPDALGDPEEPIVAELFSVERLEQHAECLAAAQTVTDEPGRGRPILPRLNDDGRYLLEAYRTLAVCHPGGAHDHAGGRVARRQLPHRRRAAPRDPGRPARHATTGSFPKLAGGPLAGYPRVLGLAWAYVAHTDSRFDPETLRRMVAAYQRVEPLTIGELWAIAISLRIILVENLRRSAERIVKGREAREMADGLADRLLGLGAAGPRDAARALPRLTDARLPTAARVQLFQRLRDQDPATTPALGWLEERLAAEGTTAEETVRREHQRQAEMNVTVRNVITSMRLLSWFDWATFVESTSLVDEAFRSDGLFATMDFATRDRYRHAVEALARRAGRTEVEVAAAAVEAAATAGPPTPGSRTPAPATTSSGPDAPRSRARSACPFRRANGCDGPSAPRRCPTSRPSCW